MGVDSPVLMNLCTILVGVIYSLLVNGLKT